MKVRLYPKSYEANLSEMVSLGLDKDGNGFYILDVKDITEHKAHNDQILPSVIKSADNKKSKTKQSK